MELFSFSSHPLGTDAIEANFFRSIDNEGAGVRDKMLSDGTKSLSLTERRLRARVDVPRRAETGHSRGPSHSGCGDFREGLNNNPDILKMMEDDGIEGSPSNLFETMFKHTLEDHAVTMVQSLSDNKSIGDVLVRSIWS